MSFNLRIESLVIESQTARHGSIPTVSVSISELRVLLLRVSVGSGVTAYFYSFNLRIESLVIERTHKE